MKEFKIGGKITLEDNKSYLIVDIVEEDGENYYFCTTMEKPILPRILKVKKFGDKSFVKIVRDKVLAEKIAKKVIENIKKEDNM